MNTLKRIPAHGNGAVGRLCGMTLVEIAISLALLGLILVGVMGSLSTSFLTQRHNSDLMECQLLTQRVLEEIQSTPYNSLLSFNGTYVDDPGGKHRARIFASTAALNLVQLEVETSTVSVGPTPNPAQPRNTVRAVTLFSNKS